MGAAWRSLDPGDCRGAEQLLGIWDAQQARSLRRPVDTVHDHGAVGSELVRKVANVPLRVLVELLLVVASSNFPLKLI